MASKKELERRIEALEQQIFNQLINNLEISVYINSAEERVVVKKNSKKGKK